MSLKVFIFIALVVTINLVLCDKSHERGNEKREKEHGNYDCKGWRPGFNNDWKEDWKCNEEKRRRALEASKIKVGGLASLNLNKNSRRPGGVQIVILPEEEQEASKIQEIVSGVETLSRPEIVPEGLENGKFSKRPDGVKIPEVPELPLEGLKKPEVPTVPELEIPKIDAIDGLKKPEVHELPLEGLKKPEVPTVPELEIPKIDAIDGLKKPELPVKVPKNPSDITNIT